MTIRTASMDEAGITIGKPDRDTRIIRILAGLVGSSEISELNRILSELKKQAQVPENQLASMIDAVQFLIEEIERNPQMAASASSPEHVKIAGAIREFSNQILNKMDLKTEQGTYGWNKLKESDMDNISRKIREKSISPGQEVDIAAYAMMLWFNRRGK